MLNSVLRFCQIRMAGFIYMSDIIQEAKRSMSVLLMPECRQRTWVMVGQRATAERGYSGNDPDKRHCCT